MEHFAKHRFAALLLALLLAAACVLPAAAATPPAGSVPFTEITPPEDAAAPPPFHQLLGAAPQTVSDEPLRAIIELEKPSLLEMGYAAADVAEDGEAAAYNEELKQYQAAVIAAIKDATGEPLDVVWRLTIVADLLSVRVLPAQMDVIAAVPGVRSIQADAIVMPMENGGTAAGETADGASSGSEADGAANGGGAAGEPAEQSEEPDWETDYTGAGQRIAIIDTGTDEWHRSLNSGAWMYALQENAKLTADQDLNKFLDSLELLDETGVAAVLDQLTLLQRYPDLLAGPDARQAAAAALAGHGEAVTVGGRTLRKIAFGANYADAGAGSYADITHNDDEHGSHVAGIAAANRYLPAESCWDPASGTLRPGAEPDYVKPEVTVKTEDDGQRTATVVGQAPDAQLLVMQVYGSGNNVESDYMAAIQNALVLGADAINLSLGSNVPGETFALTPAFQRVVNGLVNSGTIVAAAQGNSGHWTSTNAADDPDGQPALPYADDVVFDSGGAPASYDTFLAVAAADMTGSRPGMAWFSSWGVPSTLELKPEITAPGNRIASLNGAHENVYDPAPENALHGNYEEMSGTSMATPQIAGMAALVMEHLKKNYPDWGAAKRRQVAQSLLMSTAVPLACPDDPDRYYSVMQQGAGLADAKKAVTANAYITMDENAVYHPRSAADGKVKAELGQSESGLFKFSFTVHNLDPLFAHEYELRTDLFTQALTTQADGQTPALSTMTTPLLGDVRYNGAAGEDFSIEVPAGGTAEVLVGITVNDPAVNEDNYPGGTYVEGYT